MANCYDRYFKGNDISRAKAGLMYDIKNRVIYGDELTIVIDTLERNGLLEERSFERKPQGQWNDEYSRFLATGFASGYFSRDYLLYCAEVAEYLFRKKQRSKIRIVCGIAGVALVGLLVAFCRA
ncbi:hypothetical protein FACS1894137_11390 [Spirochaetia bacterium]|nr:hypothetical protein FACS1894137_11390 [Spirochaetia bacterium]